MVHGGGGGGGMPWDAWQVVDGNTTSPTNILGTVQSEIGSFWMKQGHYCVAYSLCARQLVIALLCQTQSIL